MKKDTPLLIFGQLPPTNGVAANTVQAALAFSENFQVTIVISDTAPPPTVFQKSSAIRIARIRDLKADAETFSRAKRFFILDDGYLSLFALEAYIKSPGIVWAPGGNLSRLIRDYFATQAGWPNVYANWLIEQLGEEGQIITHGLIHHRRMSQQLLEELPPRPLKGLEPNTNGPEGSLAPVINPDHVYFSSSISAFGKEQPTASKELARKQLDLDEDTVLIVSTSDGAAKKSAETLVKLTDGTKKKLLFMFVDQTEERLYQLVAAADIILISSKTNNCPPLASAAIRQAKALVCCSQPWAGALPTNCCINTLHDGALHQITAGLAALFSDGALRNWYSENLRTFTKINGLPNDIDRLALRLQDKQPALSVPSSEKKLTREQAEKPTVAAKAGALSAGGPRSVGLIGAVPPRPLLQKLAPEIDWETSPRFATPEIAEILCADDPNYAANKLALLGYEGPLIADPKKGQKGPVSCWTDVQKTLQATREALAFGCSVKGAISADALMSNKNIADYEFTLVFKKSDSPKILSHFEEDCGLFWHLDPVRHEITCLLVAGLVGKYQINLETNDHSLLVADAKHTTVIKAGQPATLTSNNQGVLSFTLVAVDNTSLEPQNHEVLTKKLADCDLSLKWFAND